MTRTPTEIGIPDLTEKRAVITGGSDGIGLRIAARLASAGAEVVLPVRNAAKGAETVETIRRETPSARVTLRQLDLSSQESVAGLATDWHERLNRIARRDPAAAFELAGDVASISRRGDVQGLAGDAHNVDRLVSAGRASRSEWALSGWAALDAMAIEGDAPTLFWSSEPRRIGQLLADSFRPSIIETADLIVVPATERTFAGAAAIDDVRLVSVGQALVDAVGLGGDARVASVKALVAMFEDADADAEREGARP